MAEQEQDRSESATPFKLQQARQRGSVAKSPDISSVFVLAAFLTCLQLWAWPAAQEQLARMASVFRQADSIVLSPSVMSDWLVPLITSTLATLGPLFGALMLAGILSSLVQHGPILSWHPVKPDVSRLSLANGIKRILSRRALFDLGKNLIKLGLLSTVLFLSIDALLPMLIALLKVDPRGYAGRILDGVAAVTFKLLMVLLAVALLDFVYAKREFAQKLRMSRREVKDEHKQREGDPKIKSRIRELQHELRRKARALKDLPDADVLVANPTHLAVALVYRHGEMAAPTILAKGSGDLVEKMKAVARRHGVTIVENRRLARALHPLELHETVPEVHYVEVARILVWIQEARKGKAAAGARH